MSVENYVCGKCEQTIPLRAFEARNKAINYICDVCLDQLTQQVEEQKKHIELLQGADETSNRVVEQLEQQVEELKKERDELRMTVMQGYNLKAEVEKENTALKKALEKIISHIHTNEESADIGYIIEIAEQALGER